MTPHNAIRKTFYFLAFRVEAVILVELDLPRHCTTHFSQEHNNDNLIAELNLLEERQDMASL